MNVQDFRQNLIQINNQSLDPNTLPNPIQKPYWRRVWGEVYPHWAGVMPDSIVKAFPNESKDQTQYRKDIHDSQTKAPLWQGIRDVKRVLMGDGMSLDGSDLLRDQLGVMKFGKEKISFEDYIWNVAYPRRVLDPNAILALIPSPTPNQNEYIPLDMQIFGSDCVEWWGMMIDGAGERFKVVILRDKTKPKDFFWVFTPNSVIKHYHRDNNWMSDLVYTHNNNDLGVYILGGQPHTTYDYASGTELSYYESDFGESVGLMNKLERQDSQIQASTITTLFPFRVVRGMECDVCEGKGYIDEYRDEKSGEIKSDYPHPHHHENDILNNNTIDFVDGEEGEGYWDDFGETYRKTCQKCKGTGTLAISQLDSLIIAPKSNNPFTDGQAEKDNLGTDFMAFVAPPVAPIQELREQKKDTQIQLEEALNLTKPSKFAESGVAKEKDREGKYTFLKGVSESMGRLMLNVAKGIFKYLTPVNRSESELNTITISLPSNFEIKSLSDLEEEMFKDIEKKDLGLRWENKKAYISQKYGSNSPEMIKENFVFEYTQGDYLYTLKELMELEGLGLRQMEDVIKAQKAPALIRLAYAKDKTKESIFNEIDDKINQAIPQPPPSTPPPLDLDGGGDE